MAGYNWGSFRLRIPIQASAANIYTAWATQNGMERWFLRSADFAKPNGALRYRDEPVRAGDSYTWLWYGYGDDTVETGEVLEANGKDLFCFTFNEAGATGMNVSVSILQEQGTHVVELVQRQIPLDEKGKAMYHIGCMQGWTFYLANLKSVLEGGADLRNKNIALKNVISS